MWNSPYFIPIAIVFICVGLPILSHTILKLARILRGDTVEVDEDGKKHRKQRFAAGQELQEMNRLLTRLEERIDSLETIVLEQNRARKTENRKSF